VFPDVNGGHSYSRDVYAAQTGAAARAGQEAAKKQVKALPGAGRRDVKSDPVIKKLDMKPIFTNKMKYSVDAESNIVIVKVIDGETDKVIKVLPPEELRMLAKQMPANGNSGMMFDEEV
jgi:flagellar protein FlaG